MQLVEQGRLSLEGPDRPTCCPIGVAAGAGGFDANGDRNCGHARNPITLRHLMTTPPASAIDMWNGDMVKNYLEKTGTPATQLPETPR